MGSAFHRNVIPSDGVWIETTCDLNAVCLDTRS